jgi:undecaprenyl-diphosphatase
VNAIFRSDDFEGCYSSLQRQRRAFPVALPAPQMNPFDTSIVYFVNRFAHHSWVFDTFVFMISDNHLLKGGVVAALIWWAWFRPSVNQLDCRKYLLCGIIACLLSVVVARALANLLPFRERPIASATLHFQSPYGHSDEDLIHWSSFPSDHAAVFFALATSIFIAWRAAGILALCHVFLFICLPRLYLGLHYPTDILVGALIGITMASLARVGLMREWIGRLAMPWMKYSPGSFYACLFIMTLQIVTLFQAAREITHFFFVLLRPHITP